MIVVSTKKEKIRYLEIILATIIFFSSFSQQNPMLPAALDPSFQTGDISILKEHVVWNCVKISMILLFCDL